ncbi:MAG: RNA polymerase sigma factor [Lachnospiraceae bacterium]|nr:RNA polymerase sigma factor [Lachnospiraceae bacterium]
MKDSSIINLFWKRDETAIRETERKYGHYLLKIAYNVLANHEDSEESVNDTYLKTWDSLPPHRPEILSAYLGKIARETAIDKLRKRSARKRGGSEYMLSLSELEDCVSGGESPEQEAEFRELVRLINRYLRKLPKENRDVFICRYYFMDETREIAAYTGCSETKIRSMLYRMRQGLRNNLEKEGIRV